MCNRTVLGGHDLIRGDATSYLVEASRLDLNDSSPIVPPQPHELLRRSVAQVYGRTASIHCQLLN